MADDMKVEQTGPRGNQRSTAASRRGEGRRGLYWCDWGQGQEPRMGGGRDKGQGLCSSPLQEVYVSPG